MEGNDSGYRYSDGCLNDSHEYLLPAVIDILEKVYITGGPRKVFDLGCGNGSVANELTKLGFECTGIDASPAGIDNARRRYPHLHLHPGSAYDDLPSQYGKYPVVLSLEVVEHLFFPRKFASVVRELLLPGGTAIISTPYHGYWKNLLLAASGKMDTHFTALWDYGHIKFWSIKTLRELLAEAGLVDISFTRVGRIPPLAKSMIAIARKPLQ